MSGNPHRWICAFVLLGAFAAAPAGASVSVEEEEIVFRLRAAGAQRMYVAGDFNGWNETLDRMVLRDTLYEIRLYLVPGSYRYRFVADGVSLPDPDNPCRDAEGNSCFVLVESRGALAIVLDSEAPGETARARSMIAPEGMLRLDAAGGRAAFAAEGRVRGTIDERVDVDVAAGLEAAGGDGDALAGESFLLSGAASYRFGERALTFFARTEAPLADETGLPLFERIGPYRYAAGLMHRGAALSGALLPGVDALVAYASRIAGYRSALDDVAAPGDPSARREMLDGDALALRLATVMGPASIHALCRFDKRPIRGEWSFANVPETALRGYERGERWGGGIEVRGDAGCSVAAAFAVGGTSRIASSGREGRSDSMRQIDIEGRWERGYRLFAGAGREGEHVDVRITFDRTTIEDLFAVGPEHTRDAVGTELSFDQGPFEARFGASIESYGASGAGDRFWLAGRSFWLDGDAVTFDRVPFFSSREIRESRLSISWRRERSDGLPWGTGTAIELKRLSASSGSAPHTFEARLRNGTPVHNRLAVILDMRGVFYRYGGSNRDFVDAFFGLHGRIAGTFWCLVGCGVNPYAFDRWLFGYADWGRERYLEDRGVFDALAARGERAAVERLFSAEEALAEDWVLSVRAGFTF